MLDIIKYGIYRNPHVGIFVATNDEHVFVPNGVAKTKAENLAEKLKTQYLNMSVCGTRLLGIMMVTNNHGILLPKTSYEYEAEILKKATDLNVDVLDSKNTALGNLICVNDKGAIVSPSITPANAKKIGDVFDVEVIQKRVAGYHQVGAMIVANSEGGIIHPETDDIDIKTISKVLGVPIEAATINGGTPYVSSGTLANNKSVVVGNLTNGPEIMMLTRAFIH